MARKTKTTPTSDSPMLPGLFDAAAPKAKDALSATTALVAPAVAAAPVSAPVIDADGDVVPEGVEAVSVSETIAGLGSEFAMKAASARADHRGRTALKRVIEKSPGFGSLALWVKYADSEETFAPAWTDGKVVTFAPAFAKFTLSEQVGVVAHELYHVAFRHVQRGAALRRISTGFDNQTFNIAIDALVNETLKGYDWLSLPGQCVDLLPLLKESLGISMTSEEALSTWSAESLYRALMDKEGASDKAKRYAEGKGFTSDMEYGDDGEGSDGEGSDEDGKGKKKGYMKDTREPKGELGDAAKDAKESREWADRLARARAGDGSKGLLRKPTADMPKVTTPWEHVLRSRLTTALMPETEETWARPSRRYLTLTSPDPRSGVEAYDMPYEQGISQDKPAMTLAVMVDTSGSIDDGLLARFSAEILRIQAATGATVHVIVADWVVQGVWELKPEPGRKDLGPVVYNGHGGTDFAPAIDVANKLKPAIGVYLTDLQGPASIKANFPIIWAVPKMYADGAHVPFGKMLVLD